MSPDRFHHWQAYFDRPRLSRGRAYLDAGAVREVAEHDGRITATVTGTKAYRVAVEFDGAVVDPAAGLFIRGIASQCSCPVGHGCKHVVAAVLAWCRDEGIPAEPAHLTMPPAQLAQPAPSAAVASPLPDFAPGRPGRAVDPLVTQWLDALGQATRPLTEPGQRMVYLLHARDDGLLEVEVVAAKLARSGRWGVGKRYRELYTLRARPPAWLDAEDHALIVALDRLCEPAIVRNSGKPLLHHGHGATGTLLARLLATGRLFVDTTQRAALRLGPAQAAHLAWITEDDRHRLALVDPAGKPFTVIPVDPPWYREGSVLGALETGCPIEQLSAIIDMPSLDDAELAAASTALAARIPSAPPAPITAAVSEPTACLARWRSGVQVDPGRWPPRAATADVVVVWFRYPTATGTVDVDPLGPAVVVAPDGALVVRNAAVEAQRLAELDAAALVPLAQQRRIGTPLAVIR
ncbi:MAG: SWIM zinc finger family protein, partial [Planctomycetes bacterium]|nr:SWIM zinc finger family protein [Planctomycetota bacterium]